MHCPRLYTLWLTLRDPAGLIRRQQQKQTIKTFLAMHPRWKEASQIRFIGRGSQSTVFSFALHNKQYVFRINNSLIDFTRNAAVSRYAGITPIPRVIETGGFVKGCCYAISEKMDGRPISILPLRTAVKVIPLMFETLESIHRLDVSHTKGYGDIDALGNGRSSSWQEFLSYHDHYRRSGQWEKEMSGTFLDQNLYDRCLRLMVPLISFCPEERSLIHGDYSLNNVLSDGRKITGVVDWAYCSIGDPLFDFSSCFFWYSNCPQGRLWLDMVIRTYRNLDNFEERVRCYMLKSALGGLANAAQTQNIRKTRHRIFLVNRMLGLWDKPIELWNNCV